MTNRQISDITHAIEQCEQGELIQIPNWDSHFASLEAPEKDNKKDGCVYMFPVILNDGTVAHLYNRIH